MMIQKKHILIFALPGIIVLLLILVLIVYRFATRNNSASTASQVSNQSQDSVVSKPKIQTIPLYTKFGEPLILSVFTNPSTGYQWQIDFDTSFFKLTNKYYTANGDNVLGSGGTQYFEFEILKTGESDITLEYKKPWEQDTSPAQTQIYQINVSEKEEL